MILIFFFIFFVPTLVVGIMAIYHSYTANINNVLTYNKSTISLLAEELNTLFERCVEIGKMVESESIIQRRLRKPLPVDKKTLYLEEFELSETLTFIHQYTVKDIFGIYVIGTNGGQYRSNSLTFQKDTKIYDFLIHAISAGGRQIWNHTEGKSMAVIVVDEDYISVSMPITDKLTGNIIGVVIVEIENRILQKYINSAKIVREGSIFLTAGSQILCYTGNSELIRYGSEFTGPKKRRRMYFSLPDNKKYRFDSVSTISGFEIMSSISIYNIRYQSIVIVSSFIIIIILIISCVLIFGYVISSFLTKPIIELSEKMNMVEKGRLDIHLEPKYNNEIGKLITSFNKMTERIKHLMEKIISDQQNFNKLRYEILQEQIKPHFLYNTLDSAIWLSRDNKSEKVVELLTSLVKMIRLSLNNGIDIIIVKDEIQHIKSYLSILKIRYDNKINYSVDVPLLANDFLIPKLTLQPFIENAVYHGIKNKKEGGWVYTKCTLENGCIHFIIQDTGIGIEQNEIHNLNNPWAENGIKGIGIRNVMERLLLYFSNEAKVWIESVVNEGTSVHIIIPQRRETINENP